MTPQLALQIQFCPCEEAMGPEKEEREIESGGILLKSIN